MSKKNNYVLASLNGKTMMCEFDDPRLENRSYKITTGKFIKDKVKANGKKVLGTFEAGNSVNYIVYTNREAKELI